MSLSWRDRYIAVLGPDGAAIVRRRKGWSDDFDYKADAPYAVGMSPAAAAPEALGRLLAAPEIGPGELSIVLSNHFVRYLLVPWRDEIGDPAEFASFAQICVEEVYGGDSPQNGARVLRCSRERAGSPRLAAVIETPLLGALERVVADTPLKLTSIQPYLASAFNRLGSPFRRGDFLFVVAEPNRCCLLAATGGRWSRVQATNGEDQPQAVADLIDREAQLLGLDPEAMPPIYVHAPRQARLDLPECNGVKPETLSLPIPAALVGAADHLLTMAMTVA